MMNILERKLRVYFDTVRMTSDSGTKLVVESDGRAGNGSSHWRAVKVNGRLVACLSDWGTSRRGGAEVVLAKRGNLRGQPMKEFPNLMAATTYLLAVL